MRRKSPHAKSSRAPIDVSTNVPFGRADGAPEKPGRRGTPHGIIPRETLFHSHTLYFLCGEAVKWKHINAMETMGFSHWPYREDIYTYLYTL